MNSRNRKILVGILAVFLALMMIVPIISMIIQSAAADLQSEIDALKQEAAALAEKSDALKSKIDDLDYQKLTLVSKKELLDERIEATRLEIVNLDAQIEEYQRLIAEKEEEYEQAKQEEADHIELAKQRIRSMEENGSISYLAILFSATDFNDFLSLLDVVESIMARDEEIMNSIRDYQAATQRAKEELINAEGEAEAAKEELIAKREDMERQIVEAQEMIAVIEQDLDTYYDEYFELEEAEDEMAAQIDELVERLEAERAAAEAAAAAVNSTGSYVWPSEASRYVTSPFGLRFHPVLQYWRNHNGIDIGASYGTNVLAADGGEIVTSTYSDSYGNYIMINHGNNRYTLYAHMSQRLVSVGDSVKQGDVIGYVGSTGISTGPHIHFEIIENSTRQDPLGYFNNWIEWW